MSLRRKTCPLQRKENEMCLAILQNWHWWHQMLISRNFSLMMKSRQAQNQPSSVVKLFSAKHLTMNRNFENIIFSKSSHDLPSYTRSLVPIIPYVPLQQLPFWILLLLHSELLIEKSSWIDFKLILLVIFVCDRAIHCFSYLVIKITWVCFQYARAFWCAIS